MGLSVGWSWGTCAPFARRCQYTESYNNGRFIAHCHTTRAPSSCWPSCWTITSIAIDTVELWAPAAWHARIIQLRKKPPVVWAVHDRKFPWHCNLQSASSFPCCSVATSTPIRWRALLRGVPGQESGLWQVSDGSRVPQPDYRLHAQRGYRHHARDAQNRQQHCPSACRQDDCPCGLWR